MRILMICDNDPAGMAIAFTNAINRYSEHSCRLITTQERYGFDYQTDIHLPDIHDDDFGEVEALLQEADVFHFHMLRDEHSHLGPLVIRDYLTGKAVLHHHHGHPDYLINADQYARKYRELGRRVVVSTPDLLEVAPGSVWIPNLVPLDDVRFQPRYESSLPGDRVRICQSPTRKFHKHTAEFQRVMMGVMRDHPQVEQVVIERTRYVECLARKRACHVVFDHMRGWFGIASLESLAHGKPVVAGLDEHNVAEIKAFTGAKELPWVLARDEATLDDALRGLVIDRDRRAEIGRASRVFMERHWREQHVLARLLPIYDSL